MDKFCYEALDDDGKPFGWVVIDSMINNHSHGGLRISPHVTLSELQTLAYKMTLKFGFVGIANGGAKAGIIGNPEGPPQEKLALLRKFCVAIEPVMKDGRYYPHSDMGTTRAEIDQAFRASEHKAKEPSREQSGFFTATSVVVCASVAARHIGKKIQGITTAIEGFGKVGSAVALFLSELGAKIVAVSTSHGAILCDKGFNIPELIALSEKHGSAFVEDFQGAEKIPTKELLTLPVELLCPCGAGESINNENFGAIQAAMISSGANCPILPDSEAALQRAGILSVPDFISNCGGVLGGTMFYTGMKPNEIRSLIEKMLTPRLTRLLQQTWDKGSPILDSAEREALNRFLKIKEEAEESGWKGKFVRTGINFYRHGLIPKFLMRRVAPSYFEAKMK